MDRIMFERNVMEVDGKLYLHWYPSKKIESDIKSFKKVMNKSTWIPETNMAKILDAYNEALDSYNS